MSDSHTRTPSSPAFVAITNGSPRATDPSTPMARLAMPDPQIRAPPTGSVVVAAATGSPPASAPLPAGASSMSSFRRVARNLKLHGSRIAKWMRRPFRERVRKGDGPSPAATASDTSPKEPQDDRKRLIQLVICYRDAEGTSCEELLETPVEAVFDDGFEHDFEHETSPHPPILIRREVRREGLDHLITKYEAHQRRQSRFVKPDTPQWEPYGELRGKWGPYGEMKRYHKQEIFLQPRRFIESLLLVVEEATFDVLVTKRMIQANGLGTKTTVVGMLSAAAGQGGKRHIRDNVDSDAVEKKKTKLEISRAEQRADQDDKEKKRDAAKKANRLTANEAGSAGLPLAPRAPR